MRLKTATVHAAFCVCLPTPPGSSLNCCPPRGRPARRAEPGKAEASAGPPSGACVNEGAEDAGGGGASEAGRAGRLGGGGGEGPPTSAARSPPLGPTDVGSRGDIVLVHRSFGRNELLFKNRAVYASPENKQIFEEENQLRREGKLPKLQTHTGEKTVRFLRKCTLEIGVNDCDEWQLTDAIVARHFLRNLGVVVPPHTLKLPDEPITELGEYWCEVTVNGLDTIRVPMSVVQFSEPKSESYRLWLAQPESEDALEH
ncbi:large ribosomal subunit protein bL9m isoform X3 [Rhineura floridana]|uniref:large ribosomal subunit protein bL9m isoform X3 n=1 Tax=Rhineura floridana TaxID=261503 RepID=UPI002AC80EF1|nr:large ribosomal subunit protein bL9m isoform X3 [Rhineura floridana]